MESTPSADQSPLGSNASRSGYRSPALAQADVDINNDNFLITMAAERECEPRGRWAGANDQRDRHGDRTGPTLHDHNPGRRPSVSRSWVVTIPP